MIGSAEALVRLREEKRRIRMEHHARCKFVASQHRTLRLLRGLFNQSEVAALAGVSQSMVSDIENGRTQRIGAEALWRVLSAYAALGESAWTSTATR